MNIRGPERFWRRVLYNRVMKNVQTILLGLIIALGVIYIGYNETRWERSKDNSDTHSEHFLKHLEIGH
ncbi:MAG: hypothetical protein CL722_05235 [Chloroflexi bacterium]|nr:hypothetical protein [Chloroflexota bacterium]